MWIVNLYKDAFNGLTKEVYQLSFMMLINRIGTLILPFLTLYTTEELDWSTSDGAIAASCFGFGSLAGAYLGGVMTDKIGYYKTMSFGLLIAGILFFFAQYIFDFHLFCLALFIASMTADTLRPALYTGIGFVTDKETQTRAISLMRMSFNLGFAIGPAIAGVFIIYFGYRSIFILDGVTCLAAGIFLLNFIKDFEPKEDIKKVKEKINRTTSSPYTDGPFLMFLLCCLIVLIAFFCIVYMLPLYIKNSLSYSEKEVGFFYAVNGIIIFIFEMPIIRYIEKQNLSKFKSLIYGGLMMSLALFCLIIPNIYLIPLILYTILVSFGELINFPFISNTAMNRGGEENIGKYMGFSSMVFSLAIILSPLLGAYLLENYGFSVLWLVMGLISLIGTFGFVFLSSTFEKS